jgi:hypothetical protein
MVEEQVRVLQPLHIVIAAETVASRAGASATIVSTPAVVRFIFKEEGETSLHSRELPPRSKIPFSTITLSAPCPLVGGSSSAGSAIWVETLKRSK